jgi:hypothetical protein
MWKTLAEKLPEGSIAMSQYKDRRLWVLGGNDGEMEVIKHLLGMVGEKWVQPKREWGDHVYTTAEVGLDINNIAKLEDVFFVECKHSSQSWWERELTVIDHHGDRSGEPASVFQVLDILEKSGLRISWQTRRWIELVAANDCGGYPGLEAIGATSEEIKRVRIFTKKAQGITAKDEAEAKRALSCAKSCGNALYISMMHKKFSPVIDLLYEAGQDENVLISGGKQLNFFGDGAVCAKLMEEFGGWVGGAGLNVSGDKRAYWGHAAPVNPDAVMAVINNRVVL